jgi:hypothetical protein
MVVVNAASPLTAFSWHPIVEAVFMPLMTDGRVVTEQRPTLQSEIKRGIVHLAEDRGGNVFDTDRVEIILVQPRAPSTRRWQSRPSSVPPGVEKFRRLNESPKAFWKRLDVSGGQHERVGFQRGPVGI